MEDITVKGPELRSKDETVSCCTPVLDWETPWVDPNHVRLVVDGVIAALRRKYCVVRQKPEEGSLRFTQTGGVCMDFLHGSEEQGDDGEEGRYQQYMITELIFGVLGHTLLWLKGEGGIPNELMQRGVLCPKTMFDAWMAFSRTGSLADLEEAIGKAEVVPLKPGVWVLSEMTQKWVRAWKARHIASWMRKLEDENIIMSAEEVLTILASTKRRKGIRTETWTREYLLCCVDM